MPNDVGGDIDTQYQLLAGQQGSCVRARAESGVVGRGRGWWSDTNMWGLAEFGSDVARDRASAGESIEEGKAVASTQWR